MWCLNQPCSETFFLGGQFGVQGGESNRQFQSPYKQKELFSLIFVPQFGKYDLSRGGGDADNHQLKKHDIVTNAQVGNSNLLRTIK